MSNLAIRAVWKMMSECMHGALKLAVWLEAVFHWETSALRWSNTKDRKANIKDDHRSCQRPLWPTDGSWCIRNAPPGPARDGTALWSVELLTRWLQSPDFSLVLDASSCSCEPGLGRGGSTDNYQKWFVPTRAALWCPPLSCCLVKFCQACILIITLLTALIMQLSL